MCGRIAIPVRLMRNGLRVVSLLQSNKRIKNNSYCLLNINLRSMEGPL